MKGTWSGEREGRRWAEGGRDVSREGRNLQQLTGNSGKAQEKQKEITHEIQGALPCYDSKWSFQTLLLTLLNPC